MRFKLLAEFDKNGLNSCFAQYFKQPTKEIEAIINHFDAMVML
jgi:hypothetical protein